MSVITRSASGQPCVRCGIEDGTICARHYNGVRQQSYVAGPIPRGERSWSGGAMTIENHSSDSLFTEGSTAGWTDKQERSEHFLHYIMLTNIDRFNRGDLK